MPNLYFQVPWTTNEGFAPGVLRLSQNDYADQTIIFEIVCNTETPSFTGYGARLHGTKPDGTVYDYPCTVDWNSQRVSLDVTAQMTLVPGHTVAELVFSKTGAQHSSPNFIICVEPTPLDPDGHISEDDISALEVTSSQLAELEAAINSRPFYSPATPSANGLMTAADKAKLDGIEAQASKTTVVNNLTSTSTTAALSAKQGKILNDKINGFYNRRYVLVGDSYTDPSYCTEFISSLNQLGITFSQTYAVSGSGFFADPNNDETMGLSWVRAMWNFVADDTVTDVVIVGGLNDFYNYTTDFDKRGCVLTHIPWFIQGVHDKFPNAKAHFYLCGNYLSDDYAQNNLGHDKHLYYTDLVSFNDGTFEVVEGSWNCFLTYSDRLDAAHPNHDGQVRMASLIGSSIKNNFAPICRHESYDWQRMGSRVNTLFADTGNWTSLTLSSLGSAISQTIDGDETTIQFGDWFFTTPEVNKPVLFTYIPGTTWWETQYFKMIRFDTPLCSGSPAGSDSNGMSYSYTGIGSAVINAVGTDGTEVLWESAGQWVFTQNTLWFRPTTYPPNIAAKLSGLLAGTYNWYITAIHFNGTQKLTSNTFYAPVGMT